MINCIQNTVYLYELEKFENALKKGMRFMGKYLNPGNAGFQSILKGIYVDKTGLIDYINSTLGTPSKLTCVSRPRRFGKSFAAKMLCAYYDKSCDSRELFQGLKIAESPFFEAHLNNYDVLYLDITWFIAISESIENTLKNLQRAVIKELKDAYPNLINKEEKSLPMALSDVSEETGKKYIIIIDEWDALFRESKENQKQQEEYVQFLRGLFRSSLTDKMVEAAYMTGILPIKKYGNQSALSDFKEFTMIQPKMLARYVGFTGMEVESLCEEYRMDFKEMERWYDGYTFSKEKAVYSPNSVMEAIRNEEFGTYWIETETYESLKAYIGINFDGLKEAVISMLGGERCRIDTGTFQNDMMTFKSKDDVLTLLVHLGYLAYDALTESVFIPNQEVKEEFIRAIKNGSSSELVKKIQDSDKLIEATLRMDGEEVARLIEKAHEINAAPRFYNNEQALRSVIRLAYISHVKNYMEFQELPGGNGYADIVYMPKKDSSKPLLLIELKWNKTAEGAIEQIRNKHYMQPIEDYGGDILLVGINYDGKSKHHECVIERYCK